MATLYLFGCTTAESEPIVMMDHLDAANDGAKRKQHGSTPYVAKQNNFAFQKDLRFSVCGYDF